MASFVGRLLYFSINLNTSPNNNCSTRLPKYSSLIKGKTFLDVGCGGGILAEAIYDKGAEVTGIDAAGPGINAAKVHASKSSKDIRYIEGSNFAIKLV